MRIGIVGHEARKFTAETERAARKIIRELLAPKGTTLVSGRCHLGGIDVWAEEIADELGREKIIHVPRTLSWNTGFRPRNLFIARDSDECHCIVVRELPKEYAGMHFSSCYHCKTTDHVKSGGCWTTRRSKKGIWHVV